MKDKVLRTSKDFLKIQRLKNQGKIIGLCHGVFDILHVGHINHFLEAKKKCEILIVSLTKDEFINKGPNRPVFKTENREKFLSNLSCVDFIYVSNKTTIGYWIYNNLIRSNKYIFNNFIIIINN